MKTVMRQMKNNKYPGYDELLVDKIKTLGPVGSQFLYQVLRQKTENQKTGIKESSYQFTRRETGHWKL
jgi:hypothetical protein